MKLVKINGKVMVVTETLINLDDMEFHRAQKQKELDDMDRDIEKVKMKQKAR